MHDVGGDGVVVVHIDTVENKAVVVAVVCCQATAMKADPKLVVDVLVKEVAFVVGDGLQVLRCQLKEFGFVGFQVQTGDAQVGSCEPSLVETVNIDVEQVFAVDANGGVFG